MAKLSIWLYGKPSWDLEIEGKNKLNPKIFRIKGDYLKEHLYEVADTLKKLQSVGWNLVERYGALYSLELYRNNLTKEEARKELKKLKINLNLVNTE